MAYTGTTETVYYNTCEDMPPSPGSSGVDCLWQPIKRTVLIPVSEDLNLDALQLSDLFSGFIALFGVVFVILIIKKAIEQ